MKTLKLFLVVLLFFVPLVLSGQISNQTVGGWKIIGTSGSVNVANLRVVADTNWRDDVNGKHSLSLSVKSNQYDNPSITLEKRYQKTFQKSSGVGGGLAIYTKKMDRNGYLDVFVYFGDSLVTGLFVPGAFVGYFYPFLFSLNSSPELFNKVKIEVWLHGTKDIEIFFDMLNLTDAGGYPKIVIDDFEDTTVPVRDEPALPVSFKLFQNYPNPFNPQTSIKYEVSSIQYVNITVYDILGREIVILVNEEKFPGSYEVKFNAPHLPSGTYFYRLSVGNYTETKKMLLIK